MQSTLNIRSPNSVQEIAFSNCDIQNILLLLDKSSRLLVEPDSRFGQFTVDVSLKMTYSLSSYEEVKNIIF